MYKRTDCVFMDLYAVFKFFFIGPIGSLQKQREITLLSLSVCTERDCSQDQKMYKIKMIKYSNFFFFDKETG